MSAGAFLQALPEVPGAPCGPGKGLTAAQLFHHPRLFVLPLLFCNYSCRTMGRGCMNPSGRRPRDSRINGLMDVLTGVYSPDAGGRHQDALSHLGGPAGFLVIFRLSFDEHPLVAEAISSPQCVCTLRLTSSTLHHVHPENSPVTQHIH